MKSLLKAGVVGVEPTLKSWFRRPVHQSDMPYSEKTGAEGLEPPPAGFGDLDATITPRTYKSLFSFPTSYLRFRK